MGLVTDSLLVDALLAAGTLLVLLYYYLTATFDHWKKRGVPYVNPTIIFGNLKDQLLQRKPMFFVLQDIYNSLSGERFGGYFESRTPSLMIRDAELIERVLIKDFSHFSDRGLAFDAKRDPLAGNLSTLKGQLWRNLRNKLTPTFTTGKLKGMVVQMGNCGDELLDEIDTKISLDEAVDAKKLGMTFSIDVTASCSFGLQFKAGSPEGAQFRKMTEAVFAPSRKQMLKFFLILYCPSVAKLLGIRRIPNEVTNYILDLVRTTMQFREKNNIHRNDFLQLMMNLKTQEETGKEMNWKSELSEEDAYLNQLDYSKDSNQENGVKIMTDECIAAQSFVFLTGGAETVANAVSYMMFELARNPGIQDRLQKEVDSVLAKYGGKLTYEGLKEMTYLDMVIQERNRLYSEAGFLMRVCGANYTLPGTEVVVEKGTKLIIPVYPIHHDPTIYPDPDKFIPERFEGNNYRSSGTYMPFGDGPRVCIAMRFVILELKACVAKVMSRFSVTLDSRTKVPLQYNPKSFVPLPMGGIWVKFHRRN